VDIVASRGVRVSIGGELSWPAVSRLLLDAEWESEPGWLTVAFDRTALCLLREEIGGKAELRRGPESTDGEFFGAEHVTLVATREPITLYGRQVRAARMACLLFDPEGIPELSVQSPGRTWPARSRIMFRDERVHTCARLLSEHDGPGGPDPYVAGLIRALLGTLSAAQTNPAPASRGALTGTVLQGVFEYIDEHLDQNVANGDLARVAGLSASAFGRRFRDLTGMSPQRWQMDARVRLAQRLLLDEPEEPLATVACRAGFSDQSHFSRAFLDIVGKSPMAWLRQRR